jgi:3-dehydroquinate dehydratase-2
MKVLVLQGPNLNLLGSREPEVYGTLSLEEIHERITEHAKALGIEVETAQSNDEGELINLIQSAPQSADALIINAGGYSHTSVAIRDAIAGVGIPAIAVHISNPHARETFRHTDLVAGACRGVVAGFGWRSYTAALDLLASQSV